MFEEFLGQLLITAHMSQYEEKHLLLICAAKVMVGGCNELFTLVMGRGTGRIIDCFFYCLIPFLTFVFFEILNTDIYMEAPFVLERIEYTNIILLRFELS